MKRLLDLFLALLVALLFMPLILILSLLVKLTSEGPVIHWSKRVGKNCEFFSMPKYRSMKIGTPQIATHLLKEPESSVTNFGRFLRKTSLDELPQLWSIIKGDMSFVGPRPALFNQNDLISIREKYGINLLTPGITGWAQINGRDDISISEKVALDVEYLNRKSLLFDIKIILLTVVKVIKKEGVQH